jgi:hypothetical protein
MLAAGWCVKICSICVKRAGLRKLESHVMRTDTLANSQINASIYQQLSGVAALAGYDLKAETNKQTKKQITKQTN